MRIGQPVTVVLMGINSQYVHSALAPWCLKAGLNAYAKAAHAVRVVEGTVNEPVPRVAERIIAAAPQVLGISCYIWNITCVASLLPLLREALPACVIVLGGPEVGYRAADVLSRFPTADFVLSGEGESPFAMLVDALAGADGQQEEPSEPTLRETAEQVPGQDHGQLSGQQAESPNNLTLDIPAQDDDDPLSQQPPTPSANQSLPRHFGRPDALIAIPGLCFRTKTGVHISPPHQHDTMQPSSYSADYFAQLDGRIAYLETSRGCPYACAFCLSGRGEKLRQAPLEQAYADILKLANSGTKTIKFVDRTFNADRARARHILAYIAAEYGRGIPEGVCFHFEIAGDLLDDATLALIGASPNGLFQFEIGLQSMDETTLHLVRRRTDMAHLAKQVSRLIACGRAHVHLDLIAGLPGETLAMFAQGFDQAYRLRPHALQLGFLKLIHGSAMREQPDTYPCVFDPKPPYQVQSTPQMHEADFAVLTTVERALDKLHNSGRFPRTLRWLTEQGGQTPFALFRMLGQAIQDAEQRNGGRSLPLDVLTDLVYATLAGNLPAHAALLRDLMLKDRLSSTPTTVLPNSLKRGDPRFHQVKRALAAMLPRQGNTPRAIGFLYAEGADQVVWCDYDARDPVTGLFTLNTADAAELLEGFGA